jgi:hypothetical protein
VIRRLLAMSATAITVLLCVITPASAAPALAAAKVRVDVQVGGRSIEGKQLKLDPSKPARITLTVHNPGGFPLRVKTVRLAGTALGLTFFAYDTSVAMNVSGGETVTQGFNLDLTDLDSQVIGLLPARVSLLDAEREVVAESRTTADVDGSLLSVYGVFGIAVLVLTALSWGAGLLALARQRLPHNRWRRALRFLPAGVGTGLVAVITLSVLRVVAPAPLAEVPLVLAFGAAAFGLGYLTPNPDDPTEPDRPATATAPELATAEAGPPTGAAP